MTTDKPVVLIMAGGKGERFWPRSRISLPKQLQKVYSNKTLLRETIDRALTITDAERIFIGTNASLKKAILSQDANFPEKNFIIEPEGKNTAPIIALSALELRKRFGNVVQIVLSADAYIHPVKEFTKTMKAAVEEARTGKLVLLGIKPNRPETGYGYIATSKQKNASYEVKSFYEKPDRKKAMSYIRKSNFYWNPGIFVWELDSILREFEIHAPEILNPLRDRFPFKKFGELRAAFQLLDSQPVDIAIMEKSASICMLEASFSWDDVGSWLSMERILPGDSNGNHHLGKSVLYYKSSGNVSVTQKELVAFLGVENMVIVEEEDVILLAQKGSLDDIKALLSDIRKNKGLQKYLE